MSKLCKSCGKYYDGEYCECGYNNPNVKTKAADKYKKYRKPKRFQSTEDAEYYEKIDKENSKKKSGERVKRDPKAGFKTLVIALIVAIGLTIFALYKAGIIFNENKDDVINKYFHSIQTGNFDDFVSCLPSEIKKDYENDLKESGLDKNTYMTELYKDFKETYGDNYSITTTLGNEKQLSESDYNFNTYKQQYGSAPSVSEVYEISAKVKFSGSKKTDEVDMYICVAKCSGKWKILPTY